MASFNWILLLVVATSLHAEKVMDLHSFDKEIDHPVFVSRWWNAGASIPLEDHIVLLPSVTDRFGAQWHKYPLLTDNFEVSFTVMIKPPASGMTPPNDQGFAFWYVYENVSAVMPQELTQSANDVSVRLRSHGWGLFGYRNQFKGLGVFFSNIKRGATDGSSEFKPSVSIMVNDGSTTMTLPMSIPTQYGSYWNFRNGALHIRLRVEKRSVLLLGIQDKSKPWIKLAELTSDKMPMDLPAGGYIGFTGQIAENKPGSGPSKFGDHDQVLIDHVIVTNMDDSQKGEESIPAAPTQQLSEEEQKKHLSEFLHDKSEGGVERAEGLAIKKFSQILFKFISETEPQKKAMMSAVTTLSGKLSVMERAVKKLKEEIVSLSGHDMDADYERMKTELSQLSSKALGDVASKKQQLETLKSEIESSIQNKVASKRASSAHVVKTLHDVDSKARDLKQQIANRGSLTLYIAIVCVILVVIAGIALQSKLKRWEKKHLL
jgi:hypothetical protein